MNLLDRYKEFGYEVEYFKLKETIRVNQILSSNENVKKKLEKRGFNLKKIPFLKNGFEVEGRFSVSSTPEHLLGLFYIQEAAAQIPINIWKPEGIVLDMAAAPGGKCLQLVENADVVIALEKKKQRINSLLNNIERLQADNVLVYNQDGKKFKGKFDNILLDAPCSGNYIIDSNWEKKRTLRHVQENAELQKDLLENAIKMLNPKGEILYSTCSLEPEENEFVIQWAIDNFEIKVEKIDCIGVEGLTNVLGEKLDNQIKNCKRIWPSLHKTSGFFIAKLRKK